MTHASMHITWTYTVYCVLKYKIRICYNKHNYNVQTKTIVLTKYRSCNKYLSGQLSKLHTSITIVLIQII